MMKTSRLPRVQIFLEILLAGGVAVLYASSALRRKFVYMPLIAIVQAAMFMYVGRAFGNPPSLVDPSSPLARQLLLLGVGGIVSLVAGYVLFLVFFTQGRDPLFPRSYRDRFGPENSSGASSQDSRDDWDVRNLRRLRAQR